MPCVRRRIGEEGDVFSLKISMFSIAPSGVSRGVLEDAFVRFGVDENASGLFFRASIADCVS